MADIYENAFVTIAATCAANSDDGLRPFRDRFKALRLGSSNYFVREGVYDFSSICVDPTDPSTLWPLLSRAWAFQELMLAPRKLRFSCYEVFWDCRTTRVGQKRHTVGCDLGDDTSNLVPFFIPLVTNSTSKMAWNYIVSQYSRLNLTYRTDTLPAIAALAQRMAKLRRNDTYLAGMWRNTLLSDIQWCTIGYTSRSESKLPSWSWARLQGSLYYTSLDTLHGVEILSLDYTPDGPAEIGAIKDAVLTIRGPALPLSVQASDSMYGIVYSVPQQVAFWSRRKLEFASDHESSPGFYLDEGQSFLALFITSDNSESEGLILRQVGTVYERVGWFFLYRWRKEEAVPGSYMEHLAQLPLTTVRII